VPFMKCLRSGGGAFGIGVSEPSGALREKSRRGVTISRLPGRSEVPTKQLISQQLAPMPAKLGIMRLSALLFLAILGAPMAALRAGVMALKLLAGDYTTLD